MIYNDFTAEVLVKPLSYLSNTIKAVVQMEMWSVSKREMLSYYISQYKLEEKPQYLAFARR